MQVPAYLLSSAVESVRPYVALHVSLYCMLIFLVVP